MSANWKERIDEAIRLSDELLALADRAEAEEHDDRLLVLFGIVRDCAHKIRQEVVREARTRAGDSK